MPRPPIPPPPTPDARSGAIVERAPPKVNLTLRVLGRRPDRYHELSSLVAFASGCGDELALSTPAPPSIATDGPFAASIAGENLIAVALSKIAAAAPDLRLGHVLLTKNLPVAAGIGGGSADVAALIRAVRRANPDAADTIDWTALATTLGADVPVCLAARAQHMAGIGELLTPAPALPPLYAVLVNPQVPVPADKTAQVFRALAAAPLPDGFARTPPAVDFASRDTLLAHMAEVGNDLLPPALAVVPAIAEVLAALRASPRCEHAALSGGGPTCFGIYPDLASADAAARILQASAPPWWIATSLLE